MSLDERKRIRAQSTKAKGRSNKGVGVEASAKQVVNGEQAQRVNQREAAPIDGANRSSEHSLKQAND